MIKRGAFDDDDDDLEDPGITWRCAPQVLIDWKLFLSGWEGGHSTPPKLDQALDSRDRIGEGNWCMRTVPFWIQLLQADLPLRQVAFAVILYAACSSTLLLINKAALHGIYSKTDIQLMKRAGGDELRA